MSKHQFTTPSEKGQMLRVQCGYDRQLNQFELSVHPENDVEANAHLRYDSLDEPSGGIKYLSKLIEKFMELKIKTPRALYMVLEYEQHMKERTNVIKSWPLPVEEQQAVDLALDQQIILSVLANDEESSDEELIEQLSAELVVITPIQVQAIVQGERSLFFMDAFHEIDFDEYLEADEDDD